MTGANHNCNLYVKVTNLHRYISMNSSFFWIINAPNSLPIEVKHAESLTPFRSRLKTFNLWTLRKLLQYFLV